MYCDKRECTTSLTVFSALVINFPAWPELNSVEPLIGLHSKGKLLVLPSNIKLDLILAYFNMKLITVAKCFIDI